jgi:hypothetical protein
MVSISLTGCQCNSCIPIILESTFLIFTSEKYAVGNNTSAGCRPWHSTSMYLLKIYIFHKPVRCFRSILVRSFSQCFHLVFTRSPSKDTLARRIPPGRTLINNTFQFILIESENHRQSTEMADTEKTPVISCYFFLLSYNKVVGILIFSTLVKINIAITKGKA